MSRLTACSLALSLAGLIGVSWVAFLARDIRQDLDRLEKAVAQQEAPTGAKKPELPADVTAEIRRLRAEAEDLRKAVAATGTPATGETLTVADVKRIITEWQEQRAREQRMKEWEAKKPALRKNAEAWLGKARLLLKLDEAQAREIESIRAEQVDRYAALNVSPSTEIVDDPVTHEKRSRFVEDLQSLEKEMEERVRAILRPEQVKLFDGLPKFQLR